MKRYLARILILTNIALLCVFFGSVWQSNANAVDELTIKIGYYGWPTSDYVEKAVFTASELYDMGTVKTDYSYWDGSKRVAIDSSIGVPLTTILDAAGIDQSSIANLDFWTADSGDGAFTSFTWTQLMGTKRYYFKDLAACFEADDEGNIVCNTDEAWKNARKVAPMMALEENWTWYEAGTEDAEGTDNLGTANRFRLNFGQAAPTEQRTFNSAKMVHTIYVMFSGTPKLTSGETNITGKVGSTHQLKVTAAAVDEALEELLESGVTWSSSDPDIVEVDSQGNLTLKKEGTATVYATSGGATQEFVIKVGEEKTEEPEEQKEEEPKNTDKTAGKGSGSGKNKNGGNGNGQTTGKTSESTAVNKTTPVRPETVRKTNTFVLSDEASKELRLALNRTAPAEEASMSTHQSEMDPDTEQLELEKQDLSGLAASMGLINGILAAEGALFGFIRYRKQRWG